MHIPTKVFKRVFHAGLLDGAPPAGSRFSQEGQCLSVSEVPYAWVAIARLGGSPIWELAKADNRFLAAHRISKKLSAVILSWGIDAGYVEMREAWVTNYTQQDENGEGFLAEGISLTLDAAIAEYGEVGEDDAFEVTAHTPKMLPFPTAKLEAHAGQKVCLAMAKDMLLMAYADVVLGYDGVFWNETLDIDALSAPRAGIFRKKVKDWTVTTPTVPLKNYDEY